METSGVLPDASVTSLSAWQRVVLTFTTPPRAFAGAGLTRSWWLPLLLVVVSSVLFTAVVGSRVGWDTVARNSMANSPKQAARLQQLPSDQQSAQYAMIAHITRVSSYVAPLPATLLFAAVIAGLLLATLNFGFGGHATYGGLFALYLFSALPQVIKYVLSALVVVAGGVGEGFQINNPLGSNPAYYLQGSGVPHPLVALLTWFDVFLLWQLMLLAIGSAVVAKLSRGKAALAVGIWTALFMLVSFGLAAV